MRRVLCSVIALLVLTTVGLAADVKCTVKKINAKNGDMTVTVKDGETEKDMDYTIPPTADLLDAGGKKLTGKKRLAGISTGDSLTITTTKKKVGDVEKDVITQVKINPK
jgi:hypothetical protein